MADAIALCCVDGAVDLHQHVAFVHVVAIGDIDALNQEKLSPSGRRTFSELMDTCSRLEEPGKTMSTRPIYTSL